MWLVRATVQQDERVLLKPAAALSVSELQQTQHSTVRSGSV